MTSTQPYTPDISDRVSIMVEDLGAAVARNWGWVLLRGLLGVAIGMTPSPIAPPRRRSSAPKPAT